MDWVVILGLFAAFCTTISFLPQAIRVIRTRRTKDLSLTMYSLFNIGVFSWLIYGLYIINWPVIIANAITLVFTLTILFMKIKYD